MEDTNYDNGLETDYYEFGPRKAKVLEISRPEGYMSFYYDHMLKEPRSTRYFKELCLKSRLERDFKLREDKRDQITFKTPINSVSNTLLKPTTKINSDLTSTKTIDSVVPELEVKEEQVLQSNSIREVIPLSIENIIPEVETKFVDKQDHLSINLTLFNLILLDMFFSNKADKKVILALPAPEIVPEHDALILETSEKLSVETELKYNLREAEVEGEKLLIHKSESFIKSSKINLSLNETSPDKFKVSSSFHEILTEQDDCKSIVNEIKFELNELILQDQEAINVSVVNYWILPESESEENDLSATSFDNPFSISHNSPPHQQVPNLVPDATELIDSSQRDNPTNSIIGERMFNFKNIHSFWEEKCKTK